MNLWATIDRNGITAPALVDILAEIQNRVRSIYGNDIYLASDSQDGQLLGIFAQEVANGNQTIIDVYNAFSPHTAQGVGLSNTVKINGLKRQPASTSTVDLEVSGTVGTTINNGIVSDGSHSWDLPSQVVIGNSGVVTVTATAQASGNIQAAPLTITTISTPTRGWQAVTNPKSGVPGNNVESDAALRQRQAVSVSYPETAILQGIVAGILNLNGIVRHAAYENSGDTTDRLGIPSHSIALVVEGGNTYDIAAAIARKKPPGTGTDGTTSRIVDNGTGFATTINFYRPTKRPIKAHITLTALSQYHTATGDAIINSLVAYINGAGIGETIYQSRAIASTVLPDSRAQHYNITSVEIATYNGTLSTSDTVLAFNELPTADPVDITITANP